MKKYKTTLKEVPIGQLKPADWNYKYDAEPDELEAIKRSIERDGSPGVLAARKLKKDSYEIIDGNHRLQALIDFGLKTIRIEDFGNITPAEAVTIASRRNEQWFMVDTGAYAKLLNEVVVPEIPLNELTEFMYETEKELNNMLALSHFDKHIVEEIKQVEQSVEKKSKPAQVQEKSQPVVQSIQPIKQSVQVEQVKDKEPEITQLPYRGPENALKILFDTPSEEMDARDLLQAIQKEKGFKHIGLAFNYLARFYKPL